MKAKATILLLIWAFVLVQPAFAYFGGKSAYGKCSKAVTPKPACTKSKTVSSTCSKKKEIKTDCSTKKCNKPSKSQEKDNCGSEGCNPTLGCSSGNFYVHNHYQITLPSWFAQRQKVFVTNDNRIVKNMSECWHPPKA